MDAYIFIRHGTKMELTTRLEPVPTAILLARVARAELAGLCRRVARTLGLRRPRPLTLDDLAIPDSALAQRATQLARDCESAMLFNHSVRTYLFGKAIGLNLGLAPDPELLYVAAILHDLALTPEHEGPGSFELHSADAARRFLQAQCVPSERADLVHEAIALHTSVGVAGSREPEIALTHFGAGLDVIGVHREDVSDATLQTVGAAWPREGFKYAFAAMLSDEAARKPGCHIARQVRLGFSKRIQAAPFSQ